MNRRGMRSDSHGILISGAYEKPHIWISVVGIGLNCNKRLDGEAKDNFDRINKSWGKKLSERISNEVQKG